MDLLILILGLVFLSVLGGSVYFFLQDKNFFSPSQAAKNIPGACGVEGQKDDLLLKKSARYEERIKSLENELKASQEQTAKSQQREQELLKEKNNNAFDNSSFEKIRAENQSLREEFKSKEEALEEIISARRRENTELIGLRQEFDSLKKKNSVTEDDLRKAKAIIENMTKDNKAANAELERQKKIIEEHNTNKTEGQWVSRDEFDRLQSLLKEKETLLLKLREQKNNG